MFAYDPDVPGLIGVRNGMIRIPRHLVSSATIGSSGDARIVSCFDGQQYYLAETKPGEIALAGLRRVENWCTARDPADPAWVKAALGSGVAPTVDAGWYNGPDGSSSARRIAFNTVGQAYGDRSYVEFAIGGYNESGRAASLWVRSFDGQLYNLVLWNGSGNSRIVSIDGTWRRLAVLTGPNLGGYSPRIQLTARGDLSPTCDILIATDPEHCPMLEVGIPSSQTAPSEVVAPDVDYGFGAPGVAYFGHKNPFAVDTNGVVTDTGQRTPISGGGIVVAGAATTFTTSSWRFSDPAHWTANNSATSVDGDAQLGPFKASTITPNATSPLYSGYYKQTTGTAGTKISVFAALKKNNGLVRIGYSGLDVNDARTLSVNTADGTYSWVHTSAPLDGGPWIIDCGDYWFVGFWTTKVLDSTSGGTDTISFEIYRNDSNDTSAFVVGGASAYIGHVSPYLAVEADAAAASRPASLMTLRWRPGLGWSPGKRLRARFTINTSSVLPEGTLLGGEDQAGTTQAALVRLVYDSTAAEYRIQVSDGTTTWIAPVAVPQASGCTISVDAGPAGASVTVQGTKVTTQSAFDFSWVYETYKGSLPDGTDHVGIPLNIEPEVV